MLGRRALSGRATAAYAVQEMPTVPPPKPDEGKTTTRTIRLGELLLEETEEIATERRESANEWIVHCIRMGRDAWREQKAKEKEAAEADHGPGSKPRK